MSEEWLTYREAAEILKIKPDTVRRMCDRGDLARHYFGPRTPRIPGDAVRNRDILASRTEKNRERAQ